MRTTNGGGFTEINNIVPEFSFSLYPNRSWRTRVACAVLSYSRNSLFSRHEPEIEISKLRGTIFCKLCYSQLD